MNMRKFYLHHNSVKLFILDDKLAFECSFDTSSLTGNFFLVLAAIATVESIPQEVWKYLKSCTIVHSTLTNNTDLYFSPLAIVYSKPGY